jgi:hypothetical protein
MGSMKVSLRKEASAASMLGSRFSTSVKRVQFANPNHSLTHSGSALEGLKIIPQFFSYLWGILVFESFKCNPDTT